MAFTNQSRLKNTRKITHIKKRTEKYEMKFLHEKNDDNE